MENFIEIKKLAAHNSTIVSIPGFVQYIRSNKNNVFLVIKNHTGLVQFYCNKKETPIEVLNTIATLTIGSTIIGTGLVSINPSVKLGGLEIVLNSITVLTLAESPLPLDANSSQELQLDWRYLSLRSDENFYLFKVQTILEHAFRSFWMDRGFIEIHSPKLMPTASESGAEVFLVDYFSRKASLAQSPQFYKQMAMCAGFGNVFEIGPVFRAESSHTVRHMTEFTSVDVEISWIKSYDEIMQLEEEMIAFALETVKEKCEDDFLPVFGQAITIPSLPFPKITLAQARVILQDSYGHTIDHKADLDPKGEKLISQYVLEQLGHQFVFITKYPSDVRPFYHMRDSENDELTMSFDLLWNGIEITTGAQREHRHEVLKAQIAKKNLSLEPLQDYVDFFRYGCPPHGGFGLGLNRFVMILTNRQNVRDATYLYRTPSRITP